jgi:hypothetical protein
MNFLNSKVIKTEKQEVIDNNGEITTTVLLHLPGTDENRKLLYSEDILILAKSQREGLATPMEL